MSFGRVKLHDWGQVCLVGARQFNAFGSHGATEHVAFRHFPTLEECCTALREQEGDRRLHGFLSAQAAHP